MKLCQILNESTTVYRKKETMQIKDGLIELFNYEHISKSLVSDKFDKIDMIFVDVVVNKTKAEQYKSDLTKILSEYPQPERLARGPSYIELAPNFEMSQEDTLRLMALGKTLGLWDIISAKALGADDAKAIELACQGFLMISGYKIA